MFSLDQTQNQSAEKNNEKSSSGLSTASRQILYHAFIVFPLFYRRKQNLLIGGYKPFDAKHFCGTGDFR